MAKYKQLAATLSPAWLAFYLKFFQKIYILRSSSFKLAIKMQVRNPPKIPGIVKVFKIPKVSSNLFFLKRDFIFHKHKTLIDPPINPIRIDAQPEVHIVQHPPIIIPPTYDEFNKCSTFIFPL